MVETCKIAYIVIILADLLRLNIRLMSNWLLIEKHAELRYVKCNCEYLSAIRKGNAITQYIRHFYAI